ncbi:bifunctional tetrahydrofolate synthase/dihydrofolate synthase [Thalassotalea sp. PS06]|uniref:bifunctional tetrahydrofolate synthase/dihydrofolate synthase n=1 Tax=Thalassotalea sp. PS06 TaxID=2594005 RepID=UPI0011638F59|nr:bifunctional tetrahydrofolate synthase/dihydrofolate synthase [Thalassotalea sp. PS06]QDP01843.1 bifunctional tetrahydrofolate synthase/dihydrofolate synthase [Thalassotalea sp. PS06]
MTKKMNSHLSLNTLDEWLFYLESIHPVEIDMTLDRILVVKERLNIAFADKKVITVGGTNGKGTTCAFIENALIASGYKVAVYSSPHIERFNERLRVNKALIDDQSLIDAFREIENQRREISLSYYEYTTLAALMICQQRDINYVILEVGLGGRLDATNIIDADVSVITSIDLDHQQFLGNDRASIGLEKAGICRTNRPAVIGEPNLPEPVKGYLSELQSINYYRNDAFFAEDNETEPGHWHWHFDNVRLTNLVPPNIPRDNVATALMVLSLISDDVTRTLTTENVNQWISQTKVPGRTEIVARHPDVMLDVAHNPHAARHLAKVIASKNYQRVHAVVGMLADKDIDSTLAAIKDQIDDWYPVSLGVGRAADAQVLVEALAKLKVNTIGFDKVSDGFKIAKDNANKNDMILVFGSFFTVAEFKKSCL